MNRAACLALVFLGLLAFSNAIQHPFVHDDVIFIVHNPHITELNHWSEVFVVPATTGGLNSYYRPVLEILYRIEYQLFGLHPYGFHLFNILVHIINGILLYVILQKLNIPAHLAWVIACIFLIHPVQTEAVCCISGISNLWMALGVLLALLAYLNQWYGASLLFFIIAFLSKEQGILFLPLLMVIDYARGVRNYRWWIVFGIVSAVLLWVHQSMTSSSLLHDIMASPQELYLRLASIPRDLGMYLRLIFVPADLHYYRSTDILKPNVFAWAITLISMGGIFYTFKRWSLYRSTIILGLGWFFAAFLPVLNIAPLINEYSFILTPEHFLYLPIVGILIIVVIVVDHLIKRFRKLLLALVICTCLILTWYQNTFWRSEIALFERMLIYEPNFGRGHLLLAKSYYFNGQPEKAEPHFRQALTIMTQYEKKATNSIAQQFYAKFITEILFDWAQNDCAMGQWGLGLDKYKQAAVINGNDPTLYNNMAFVYLHMGDKKDAILNLKQALQIDPAFTQAARNLKALGSP